MLSAAEKDLEAKARVSAFVDRSLVLLTDTPQGIRSEHPASGVLIRLNSGRIAVLTAEHTLPDHAPANLHRVGGAVFEDAIFGVARHPSDDVGLALVRQATAPHLAPYALAMEHVETSSLRKVDRGVPLVAAGFPGQFTADAPIDDTSVQHRFSAIIKYTRIHGHDDKRISFDWSEAEPIRRGTPPPHPAFDKAPGETVYLKKPVGLSGGPLYRITLGSFEDFDPKTRCKLVGISVEFKDQRELAVPWWRWIDWLRAF